jgi:hypothetical protein
MGVTSSERRPDYCDWHDKTTTTWQTGRSHAALNTLLYVMIRASGTKELSRISSPRGHCLSHSVSSGLREAALLELLEHALRSARAVDYLLLRVRARRVLDELRE